MPFHLIEFQESKDIAVVPNDWYDDGMVYWPSFKSTERVKRAAANKEKHEPNWPRYDVKIVRTCGMQITKLLFKNNFMVASCFYFYLK